MQHGNANLSFDFLGYGFSWSGSVSHAGVILITSALMRWVFPFLEKPFQNLCLRRISIPKHSDVAVTRTRISGFTQYSFLNKLSKHLIQCAPGQTSLPPNPTDVKLTSQRQNLQNTNLRLLIQQILKTQHDPDPKIACLKSLKNERSKVNRAR